jgi:hypothetical protein
MSTKVYGLYFKPANGDEMRYSSREYQRTHSENGIVTQTDEQAHERAQSAARDLNRSFKDRCPRVYVGRTDRR